MPAFLLKNPLASGLGILLLLVSLGLGVQTVRLAWERTAFANYKAEETKAILEAQRKAAALSDELIIAQASAMAVTEKKVISYVDRIHLVQGPDTACPADERMRLGSRGVSDLIRGGGPPAVGKPPAALPGPRARAGP